MVCRRCAGLISFALNLPAERQKGFSGRHGAGCKGCRNTLGSCRLAAGRHSGSSSIRALAFRARTSSARCNGSAWTDPPLFRASRSVRRPRRLQWTMLTVGLVRCAKLIRQVVALHGSCAQGNGGDAGIALKRPWMAATVAAAEIAVNAATLHDDGVASAIPRHAGGRCRRCRGGSPPYDRVGARSHSSLFTNIARIAWPLRYQLRHVARNTTGPAAHS